MPLTWLLLDIQSTVDLIANPKIMLNIRKVRIEDDIRVHCNGGFEIVDGVGDLPVYGTVRYEPNRDRRHSFNIKDDEGNYGRLRRRGRDCFLGWSSRTGK